MWSVSVGVIFPPKKKLVINDRKAPSEIVRSQMNGSKNCLRPLKTWPNLSVNATRILMGPCDRGRCKVERDRLIYELNAQTNPPETNLLVTDADLFTLYQCQLSID